MRVFPLSLASLSFVALLAVPATGLFRSASAQEEGSALTVSVRAADSQRPLPGAQVIVQGIGMGGATDPGGVLRLTALPVGARAVEVRFLGYAPERAVVVLQPGRASALAFELELQPIQLAEVKVRTRRSVLYSNGFHDRRGSGFGTFVTRDEIEDMRPRFLSDVLRRMAGINLASSAYGGSSRASMRGTKVLGSCPIQYYVDGTMTALFNVDEIRPEDVEGLEIYRGAATVPVTFNKGSAMCGVIVIWTRVQ
jgi:hypothetical protein